MDFLLIILVYLYSVEVNLPSLLVLIHYNVFSAEKVPSNTDVDDYNDPVLKEIFSAFKKSDDQPKSTTAAAVDASRFELQELDKFSQSPNKNPQAPLIPFDTVAKASKTSTLGIDPNSRPESGTNYNLPGTGSQVRNVAELPPSTGGGGTGGGGRTVVGGGENSGLDPLGTGWTQLAVQGAETFYAGVRQAGRMFGIDAGQYQPYEIPLINQGARFFGR